MWCEGYQGRARSRLRYRSLSLARMLPSVIGGPAPDRRRLVMPVRPRRGGRKAAGLAAASLTAKLVPGMHTDACAMALATPLVSVIGSPASESWSCAHTGEDTATAARRRSLRANWHSRIADRGRRARCGRRRSQTALDRCECTSRHRICRRCSGRNHRDRDGRRSWSNVGGH
jgi:hypothetical protein